MAATDQAPTRHLAHFSPCIWGDRFLSFSSHNSTNNGAYAEQVEGMKNKVREMLADPTTDKIKMIDSLHRLGVSYHFEKEIDQQLEKAFQSFEFEDIDKETDLLIKYKLVKKFKDSKCKFKETLASDTKGMLSLYEASQLRLQGEDDLEEALAFTTTHLMSAKAAITSPLLEKQVTRALGQPFHKGIPRVETRVYMSIYEEEESHNDLFLKLAKLDYNMVQQLHQRELSIISKWWKDLNLVSHLPYARDRVVECYLFVIAVYFEPCYSLARIMLIKIELLVTVIDDTYDAYGTMEELQLLTDAIERWDMDCIDNLPDYMKFLYRTLLNLLDQFQEELIKDGIESFGLYYAKEAIKELCRSYYQKAKWFKNGYVPTMDEYTAIQYGSSTIYVLTVTGYVRMGQVADQQAFRWIHGQPKILKVAEAIGRLRNDIAGSPVEQKRGHAASSVECYMKEYGISRKEAIEALYEIVANAWKDLNEECLNPTVVPMPLKTRILNTARYTEVIYTDVDAFTVPEVLKDWIVLLFLEPVPV